MVLAKRCTEAGAIKPKSRYSRRVGERERERERERESDVRKENEKKIKNRVLFSNLFLKRRKKRIRKFDCCRFDRRPETALESKENK